MSTMLAQRQRRNGGGQQQSRKRTTQLRQFKGVNRVDSRVAIGDDEFAWLENAMTIGAGAVQLLNAPGSAVATLTQGVSTLWGETLNNSPYLYAVGNDGSLSQITPGGVVTVIAGAGTLTATAGETHFAIWRGTTVLILDPNNGYMSWDGTTFTVIDATQKGVALAVFQGRAWLINGRTITFTAPNTFSDFSPANGAGSTILTDEAFAGNIIAAVSALEQLWLVGASAVEALANVTSTGTSPTVATTFSLTNIVTNIGSNAQHTVLGYLRSLTFLSPFGAYALAGVTPQKISEKLDGLFPDLTISHESASSAVAVVQNLLCLIYLVTYNGNQAIHAGPTPLLLIFVNGKWSFASQGSLVWITDIVVNGAAQAWGTDGTHIYQLFGAPSTTAIQYKIQWKLSDFGLATRLKCVIRTGAEFAASTSINPTMLIENETSGTETANLKTTVPVTWVNNAQQTVTFVNNSGQTVTWVAQGLVLSRQKSAMWGAFIGWTIQGTDAPYRLQGVQLQIEEGPDAWLTPVTAGGA